MADNSSMKNINVISETEHEARETFYAIVDGKKFLLVYAALGSFQTRLKVEQAVKYNFGNDASPVYANDWLPTA